MRRGTLSALAALPLALTLALTGCGSDGDDDGGVATANDGKSGAAAGATPKMNPTESALKFAQCMRENGIDMEDPQGGQIRLEMKKGTSKETMDKAMQACRQYDPQANAPEGSDPKAEEQGRKFAECMRKNGVEEFPDPKPGQRGVRIEGKVAEDPDIKKAQQACMSIFSGGGAGQ